MAAGAAGGWFPRPLNSTSSALEDEASEGAGEGLRMAMCAIADVLSGVEEGEDGVMDSALDSDETWAVSTSGVSFFSVPSRWPALMNSMGMCRNFLPASNAAVR